MASGLLDWALVPTRRLISIALVCGLAILIAGGIQLIRLRPERLETLTFDQPATVGGAVVNPRALETGAPPGVIRIRFDVTAGTATLDDPSLGWTLLATSPLKPTRSQCLQAGALGPRQQTSCTLDFPGSTGDAPDRWVLVYARGQDRAQWAFTS
jgi:hypothetical protein